jgi:hypothetical protein
MAWLQNEDFQCKIIHFAPTWKYVESQAVSPFNFRNGSKAVTGESRPKDAARHNRHPLAAMEKMV